MNGVHTGVKVTHRIDRIYSIYHPEVRCGHVQARGTSFVPR